MDSWANLGREKEESKSMRERDERGKGKGESVFGGKKEKSKEKERADEVTEVLAPHLQVLSALVCQPWHRNDT